VVPVAAATMTPLPLTLGLIYFKVREYLQGKEEEKAQMKPVALQQEDKDVESLKKGAPEDEDDETFKASESSHKLILKDNLDGDASRVC